MSKKTIGGQKDRRSKRIQRNTSESGIKCVCLNARSIINKKTELLWPATFAMYQLLCRVNVPVSGGHLPDAPSGQSNVISCPC